MLAYFGGSHIADSCNLQHLKGGEQMAEREMLKAEYVELINNLNKRKDCQALKRKINSFIQKYGVSCVWAGRFGDELIMGVAFDEMHMNRETVKVNI